MPASFDIGPDQGNDLRLHRPYFVVPLDDSALAQVSDRIQRWLADTAKEPTSLFFRQADVPDPVALASQLNDDQDPVSKHIKRQLSADTQRLLGLLALGYRPGSLPEVLVDELNVLLRG